MSTTSTGTIQTYDEIASHMAMVWPDPKGYRNTLKAVEDIALVRRTAKRIATGKRVLTIEELNLAQVEAEAIVRGLPCIVERRPLQVEFDFVHRVVIDDLEDLRSTDVVL